MASDSSAGDGGEAAVGYLEQAERDYRRNAAIAIFTTSVSLVVFVMGAFFYTSLRNV